MTTTVFEDCPSHCSDCGEPLFIRRPGRDLCARCSPTKAFWPADYPEGSWKGIEPHEESPR